MEQFLVAAVICMTLAFVVKSIKDFVVSSIEARKEMISVAKEYVYAMREKSDCLSHLAKNADRLTDALERYLDSEHYRFRRDQESGDRPVVEEQAGNEDDETLEAGLQPDDLLTRLSKGTKTAVQFGEDVEG